MSDKLNVLVGLRYDRFDSDDAPSVNQGFVDTFGFANGGIEGTDILNYRFSFEYEIDDVSSVKGLFGTFSQNYLLYGYQMHIQMMVSVQLHTVSLMHQQDAHLQPM